MLVASQTYSLHSSIAEAAQTRCLRERKTILLVT